MVLEVVELLSDSMARLGLLAAIALLVTSLGPVVQVGLSNLVGAAGSIDFAEEMVSVKAMGAGSVEGDGAAEKMDTGESRAAMTLEMDSADDSETLARWNIGRPRTASTLAVRMTAAYERLIFIVVVLAASLLMGRTMVDVPGSG